MINSVSNICDPSENDVYDFLFIGLGASNSLILLSLIKNKQLERKKIGIIEPENKNINDKTFCFWAKPTEDIVTELKSIISYKYTKIKVANKEQDIAAQPYYYIKSLDLYKHTHEALKPYNIDLYRDAAIESHTENNILVIKSKSGKVYKTKFAFDSRPPSIEKLTDSDIYLHQSFYGLHIKCDEPKFNKSSFEMMNFNVEQSNYTQFVYILPFSENEALVELTRFGKDKIEKKYAQDTLHTFITEVLGNYSIIDIEVGCIPMTSHLNNFNPSDRILNTGSSANLIKPSTGYGFKKMFEFGNITSEIIKQNNLKSFNKTAIKLANRFRFYDKLLLIILLHWPSEGKKIFKQLFTKKNIADIFLFLDEKTTLIQDIKIFLKLPIITFIKALRIYIIKEKLIRYFILGFIALTYPIVYSFSNELASYFCYIVLIIGFLLIGIPHGAVDHILLKNKKTPLLNFVLIYISISILYFAIWLNFPLFSLVLFVIFSAFHFGESEMEEKNIKITSFNEHITAFFLGIGILNFIIFSHPFESKEIIIKINDFPMPIFENENYYIYSNIISVISLTSIILIGVLRKKITYASLIFILFIGIKLPLILSFGIYFIFQHSFNAWNHLKKGFKINSISLYKKALPFTLGGFFLLLLIFLINLKKNIFEVDVSTSVFIFLACISLPHFVMMHRYYKIEKF